MGGMRYQPQGLARLSSIADALGAQAVFVGGSNVMTGSRLATAQSVTREGIGATVVLTNTTPISIGAPVASSWTLLMVIRRDTDREYPYFMGMSGGAYQVAMIGQHDSIGNRMGWFDSNAVLDSGFTQPLGEVDTIGLTFDGTTRRYSWYKNGRAYNSSIGSNTGGGIWQFAAVSDVEFATNTFPLIAIGARAASAADMVLLTANPWQLFDDPYEDDDLIAAATVPQSQVLSVSATTQSSASTSVAIKQRQKIVIGGTVQASTSAPVSAKARAKLVIASAAQSSASPAVAIKARHVLTPVAATQVSLSPSLPLKARHKLALASVAQASSSPAVAVTVPQPGRHALTVASASQANDSPAIVVRQRHKLTLVSVAQSSASPAIAARARMRLTLAALTQSSLSPPIRFATAGGTYTIDLRRVLTLGAENRYLVMGVEDRALGLGIDNRILETQGG